MSKKNLRNIVVTYSMGVMNDNFYKQAVLLLAASAALPHIQGWGTIMFAMPFIIFSSWAGWFADHFSKSKIIFGSKIVELMTMIFAIVAMYYNNWTMMIAVIFLMACQSTFFSPSLNGSIPEYFSSEDVPRVNAVIKMITTIFMLVGIAVGGFVLDIPKPSIEFIDKFIPLTGDKPFGRILAGATAAVVSIIGLITAFLIKPTKKQCEERRPFPIFGPFNSLVHMKEYSKKDPQLLLVLFMESYFYVIAGFAVLCINNLGVRQLGLSFTVTSLLSVALMIGVGIGSMQAGRDDAFSWQRNSLASGLKISIGLVATNLIFILPSALYIPFLVSIFVFVGINGGRYLIPLMSFLQTRPPKEEKGKVLGIGNFLAFSGILLGGAVFGKVNAVDGNSFAMHAPSMLLLYGGILTALTIFMATYIMRRISTVPMQGFISTVLGVVLLSALSLRYRIQVKGLEKIEAPGDKPLLFLPNHPALIDPVILCILMRGIAPRPISASSRMEGIFGKLAIALVNPIILPEEREKDSIQTVYATLEATTNVLNEGGKVLFYPTGQIRRANDESLCGRSGVYRVLKAATTDVRVICVRFTGLWGSSFSFGLNGENPEFGKCFFSGIWKLIPNFIFFMPKRDVLIEFVESDNFPKNSKTEINTQLHEFFNCSEREPIHTPYFFWQKRK